MADIASLVWKVDSTDLKKADDALDDLGAAAKRAEDSVEDFEATTKRAGRTAKTFTTGTTRAGSATKAMGRNAGQAGIQLQQFVGQVQAGTSATVALSQQAADLGIVLGAPLVGVVVSLGAALAGTLFAAMKKGEVASEDLAEQIRELTDNYKNLTVAQAEFIRQDTTRQIAAQEERVRELRDSQKLENDELERFQANLARSELKNHTAGVKIWTERTDEQKAALGELNAQIDTEVQKLAALQGQLDSVNAGTLGNDPEDAAAAAVEAAANRNEQLRKEWLAAQDQPWMIGVADPDTLEAALLAIEARISVHAKARNEALRKEWLAAQDQPWMVGVVDPDTMDAALTAMDERIDTAREARLDKDRKAADERIRLEQKVSGFAADTFNSIAGIAIDAAERRADGEGKAAEKAFETQQDLNSGLIIANTAVGVMNALKFGAPGERWFEAAAVGAEGLRQLISNNSASFDGGGSIAAPSSGPPAGVTTTNTQTNNVSINVTGGGDPQSIVAALQQYYDNDGRFITD